MTIMLLGGLGISYEKVVGLRVASPPNTTLLFLILILLDLEGPNISKQYFSCTHATMHMNTCTIAPSLERIILIRILVGPTLTSLW